MRNNKWLWLLSSLFILTFIGGVVVVAVLVNRPFVDYRITSPTALPLTDPFIVTQTARPSPTLNPTTAMTMVPITSAPCGWQWATEANPELSAEIQQRLDEQLPEQVTAEVQVESFGENCINNDGSARGFGAMQTDFRITVSTDSTEAIAPVLEQILLMLKDYPPDTNPGPMGGMIGIEFSDQAVVKRLWARYDYVMDVLEQGLTGQALIDALDLNTDN